MPGTSGGSRDALRRLDALAQVGLRLARSAPSGRIVLAQLALGTDPRWIPQPWGEDLLAEMEAAKQGSVEPLSRKRVEQSLREAWGVKPADELDDLEPEPTAVTPTSQVHRGVHRGDPVAVKVQRPGLARSVRQDLALLDSLVTPLTAAFPSLDAQGVLREIGERVRDESDLEHEASNARRMQRGLRGHPRLVVPAPVTRLASQGVLVREWIDGTPPDQADDATKNATSEQLIAFVLGGGRAGIMNAGLTAEDVLALPDGRVAIVDQGTCCEVDRARAEPTLEAVEALLGDDPAGFAQALNELGWLDPEHAPKALRLVRAVLGPLLGPAPVTLDADAVREAGLRILPHRTDALALGRAASPAPADIWPLRGIAQLFATIASIGASGDFPQLTAAGLRDGWDQPA